MRLLFLDAEQLIIDFLRPVTSYPVIWWETKTGPGGLPFSLPLIKVRRIGGTTFNRIQEDAVMDITVCTTYPDSGIKTASTIREALVNNWGQIPQCRGIDIDGFGFDPDPDTGLPRYSMTATVHLRASRRPERYLP